MQKLYTVLYAFISTSLGLRGLAKETFAVIFGFWLGAGQMPVPISLGVFRAITGGSRQAIITAIRQLEDQHLISVKRSEGHRSIYSITIDSELLRSFNDTFTEHTVETGRNKPVKRLYQEGLREWTGNGPLTIPQKKKDSNNTLKVLSHPDKGSLKEVN